jgi:hypothetical protein
LPEVSEVIKTNTKQEKAEGDYEGVVSYSEVAREFDKIVEMLPVKINF